MHDDPGTGCVDGQQAGEGRIDATPPFVFSVDEGLDIGLETGAPVSSEYGATGNAFSGEVNRVLIEVEAAAQDADHLIAPEERFKVAVMVQ